MAMADAAGALMLVYCLSRIFGVLFEDGFGLKVCL